LRTGEVERELLEKGENLTLTFAYDANGNRILILTPEGYRISREYDCRDRLIRERVEDKENGISLRTFFTYDRTGNVISVRREGEEGKTQEIGCSHDLKDRLTRVEEADGPVFLMSYDKNGSVAERQRLSAVETECYDTFRYRYDEKGNLLESLHNGRTEERNEYDRKNCLVKHVDGDGIEVRCPTDYRMNRVARRISQDRG